MKAIWLIGKQSLQFLMKDKTGFIWFLLVPIAYVFIFGNAFRQSGSDPSSQKAQLVVVKQDSGFYSDRLLSYLNSENLTMDIQSQKPDENPARMLVIPDTFSANLTAGKPVKLLFSKKASADAQAAMTANIAIRKAYISLLADIAQLKLSNRRVNQTGFNQLDQRLPLITVQSEFAGKHQSIPAGFNQQVPAQIVQFSTLMLFIYAGSSLLDEKRRGLLRRIKTTPIHFYQLFLGKLLFILLLGISQSLLILGFGRFVFGVYLGSSPVALLMILISFILAIGSIALCLGFLFNQPEKMLGIAIIFGLILSALSGCWWPIEITPEWSQKLASILPTGIALKSLHMLISFGKGTSDVLPYFIQLILIAGLFSTIFGRLLTKYQKD